MTLIVLTIWYEGYNTEKKIIREKSEFEPMRQMNYSYFDT